MGKSLTQLVRTTLSNAKSSSTSIPTDLPEYVSSFTDDLYVIGHKGDTPVKIKVRSNDCCNGIELSSGEGGGTVIEGGLKYGEIYPSFEALASILNVLEENTIYGVNDKGTTEQYICIIEEDNRILKQVSGGFNYIISDPGTASSVCPLQNEINDGILDFNLPELVIGDFLFKNHSELHTFISDLPSLKSAKEMFAGTSLTSFQGDLSSLESADNMFANGPQLNYQSLLIIADTIKNVNDVEGTHKIFIGYDSSAITEAEKNTFNDEISAKGWDITWEAF